MVTTPRPIIDSVVRSVCGRSVERLVPLAGGGMSETYRAELGTAGAVVVRIAHQPTPWFVDEAHLMAQAHDVGVPTAEVLGLAHLDHDGGLLSFSIQRFLPGRLLSELTGELPAAELERVIMDAGEILARIHSVVPDDDRGIRHELRMPEEHEVARVARIVAETLDPAAAALIERGADFLRQEVTRRPAPPRSLAQGDFMPKNLLVHDGNVTGVIDWEFAGPASPAFDLARWEVSAGAPFHDRLDLLRRGYARVADPESADDGLTPAFAIDWILEKLGWRKPASPAQFRRCVEVVARYLTADDETEADLMTKPPSTTHDDDIGLPEVVSPSEWRASFEELLIKEKALTAARDELSAARRRMPMMRVDTGYRFVGPDGEVGLVDLFEGRRQLIVYRFFYAPDVEGWPEGACSGCSLFADSVSHPAHLNARDTTIAFVSAAPQERIEAYRDRMGWSVPWYTLVGDDFSRDFDVEDYFGLNVFIRDDDEVFRTYFVNGRGVETTAHALTFLDLTPLGRQEHWEDSLPGRPQGEPYQWWRRHDEYGQP